MNNGEFDRNFLKSIISWLKPRNPEEIQRILTSITLEIATTTPTPSPIVEIPETTAPAPAPAPATETTLVKTNAYVDFGHSIHSALKAKYPKYTPQQMIKHKAKLWQIKKKNPSLTNEQILQLDNEETNEIVVPAPAPLPTTLIVAIRRPAKRKIPIHVRRQVWNTHIGQNFTQWKCLCCNSTAIDRDNYECGHIIAEANGGDESISNLRPICVGCNRSMSTTNMREFAKKHFGRDLGF